MSRLYALVLVLAGCGRIGFDVDGDVVIFTFDELRGTTAPASVPAYSGTCAAKCPTVVPGVIGNAYSFAGGLDEFVQLPSISTDLLGTAPFTVTLWSNAGPGSGRAYLSKTFDPVEDKNVASVLINASGGPMFETTETGLDYSALSLNEAVLVDNLWHHVAARWDGTTKSLFVDGENVGETHAILADSDMPVRIGADLDRLGPANLYKGLVDDMHIYRRALSDSEIADLATNY